MFACFFAEQKPHTTKVWQNYLEVTVNYFWEHFYISVKPNSKLSEEIDKYLKKLLKSIKTHLHNWLILSWTDITYWLKESVTKLPWILKLFPFVSGLICIFSEKIPAHNNFYHILIWKIICGLTESKTTAI